MICIPDNCHPMTRQCHSGTGVNGNNVLSNMTHQCDSVAGVNEKNVLSNMTHQWDSVAGVNGKNVLSNISVTVSLVSTERMSSVT